MTSPLAGPAAPFGRVLTAMVTPFTPDGAQDLATAQKVATYLVDAGNDGLVVSGTTGESPTTTIAEDGRLLAAVLEAVGDRATVVAGVGTNDTRHSVELAEQARRTGAHGLLVVTPYYSRPPQRGIVAHVRQVARAGGDVPIMLYDIPGRTGVQLSEDTYREFTADPTVVAMKDAVGDLERGAWIMSETGLAVYSGDDALNLGWLAIGAAGVVSVVGHAAAADYAAMVRAVDAGDLPAARAINTRLVPAVRALMTTSQGAMTAKVALQLLGVLEHATVRSPLPPATDDEIAAIRAGLVAAHLLEA
ncbi:dihydrodipicolinate synthase [Aeromicrobium marinum DSM 15272]|uniref:4-hydroxy-tetrahydrodipicolinate synthase n=1 Tax=Aeromicrobium marinum DSM 15272 TaxID=585531 RepID=E2SEF9_9ACTN|nr:4-hydroxy-tetrahydrodipicolinate synthase [Aeromicrobium marinum]EFQ82436.1 dihydrodipicolinate synthase [Aeromicrobium marinum DSM 15272]